MASVSAIHLVTVEHFEYPPEACNSRSILFYYENVVITEHAEVTYGITLQDIKNCYIGFINSTVEVIPVDILGHFPQAVTFYANNVGLKSIGEVFEKPNQIKNIHLSENKLRILNKTQFEGASFLYQIDLSKNFLEILPRDCFTIKSNDSFQDLIEIDLSFNQIRIIEFGAFYKTPNLKVLKLQHNKLTTDLYGVFPSKLEILDLSYNGRLSFFIGFIVNCEYLKVLKLNGNKLGGNGIYPQEFLPDYIFEILRGNPQIEMSNCMSCRQLAKLILYTPRIQRPTNSKLITYDLEVINSPNVNGVGCS